LVVKSDNFLEDHAHVVQAGDEGGSVDLLAAAVAVRKPDDVGAVLRKPGGEGQAFRVVDQRYVSRLAVGAVAGDAGKANAAMAAGRVY
jgi:hypothetical protein